MIKFLGKIWKHILCVIGMFFGMWIFNHISAWVGIFTTALFVVLFVEFTVNLIKNEYVKKV